jgi:hypothetical protein
MALELKPTISLSGTAAHLGATLSLSHSDVLSVKPPMIGITRQTISTSSNQEIIDNSYSDDVFVYIRNTDAAQTVELLMTDDSNFGQLHPGEFAFFPLKASAGLEVKTLASTAVIEYAFWTRA